MNRECNHDSCGSTCGHKPELNKKEIKELGYEGKICEVFGHRWVNTTSQIMYPTDPPQYPDEERTCTICGEVQVKYKPEWVSTTKYHTQTPIK